MRVVHRWGRMRASAAAISAASEKRSNRCTKPAPRNATGRRYPGHGIDQRQRRCAIARGPAIEKSDAGHRSTGGEERGKETRFRPALEGDPAYRHIGDDEEDRRLGESPGEEQRGHA